MMKLNKMATKKTTMITEATKPREKETIKNLRHSQNGTITQIATFKLSQLASV